MKHRNRLGAAVLLLLVGGALVASAAPPGSRNGASAPSLSDLLEKAIFTEETVGDLDAAIELYREIISRAEANRPFVARAQYRLGLCHLKKGQKDEAATVLRGLVADFPKQEDLVEQASARLAELGYSAPTAGVQLRQVWDDADDYLGAPSPDGRYLTFTDWSTGDLALRDLETERNRLLTRKGSWETPHYAEYSIFSPDGRTIAYAWYGSETIYELRVIGVDGSGSRRIYGGKDTRWIQPLDWTPDGKQILAWLYTADGSDQIALVSVEDGTARTIGTLPGYEPGRTDLSPDGRRVVYSRAQEGDARRRDVFTMSTESGGNRPLIEHPADDIALGWSPDGRQVFFASDRTGQWSAWSIAVDDGKAADAPKLLKAGLGDLLGQIKPMGFARDGSYFYGLATSLTDVFAAKIDPTSGKIVGSPAKSTRRFEGSNSNPGWSRDGKRLAWISRRAGAYFLVVQDAEGGDERDVPVSPSIHRIHRFHNLRWTPDGSSVIVTAATFSPEFHWGVFSIDIVTGAASRVVGATPDGILDHPDWSPDGKTLYFERNRLTGAAIVALDRRSGKERVVAAEPVGNLALSPDGRWIAFTTDFYDQQERGELPALKLVRAAGGEPRVVFRSTVDEPFDSRAPLAWTADGTHLLFGTGRLPASKPADARLDLWRVALEGGDRRRVGIAMPHLTQLVTHPDGRRLAFVAGERKTEIWVMENFLPEPSAKR